MVLARIPPIVLVVVGVALTVGLANAWLGGAGTATAPWWAYLLLALLGIAMTAMAGAVVLDPGSIIMRRALAGAALVWLVFLTAAFLLAANAGRLGADALVLFLMVAAIGIALGGLAATTGDVTEDETDPLGRLGAVVAFAVAILMAAGAAVVVVSLAGAVANAVSRDESLDLLPWLAFAVVLVVPPVTFAIASFASRRAAGGTFYSQAAANRRNSVLLLVALIGIVAATVEIITVSLTYDPVPALWAAGIAILVGIAAAVGADRFGSGIILDSAGAKRADPRRDRELVDVVGEIALAANIPIPAIYVIEDGSENAFATGRDPAHASVAVTRGLLKRMDREELQGVVGHELGHVRNLDTRYALYIAVFVGLVALVTDGFLRIVVRAWREGVFLRGKKKAFVAGLLVGLFLLIVAVLLRLLAPLFAALVQAATSREREFLADATSVELTRNPRALERALTSLAGDQDTLEAANRGTQHLWFRNPVREGSDRRTSLFATHPSLAARIDRLRVLQGLDPLDPQAAELPAAET